MSDVDDYQARLLAMGGGDGKTGPRDASPAPAPRSHADWGQGLDSANASAMDVSQWLQDVFKRHRGGEPPAALVRQLDELGGELTGEGPKEPAYGPGLWTTMPQRGVKTMAMARPLDLNGAPSPIEIDLMMEHAIRMGERLCRTYPTWAQTLPGCWIRHDYIVEEVFALACYADLVAGSANGGYYAPTLQANMQAALQRIQEQMKAEGADRKDHDHHLADKDSRSKAGDRLTEYTRWTANKKPWDVRPKGHGWQAGDGFADEIVRYGWPAPLTRQTPAGDSLLADQLEQWDQWYTGLMQRLDHQAPGSEEDRADALTEAEGDAEEMERRMDEWLFREARAHDRLDRAWAAARNRLDDRDDPLTAEDAKRLRALAEQAEAILTDAGEPGREGYRPKPIAAQERLRLAMEDLCDRHDDDPLQRMRRVITAARNALHGWGRAR